MNLFASRMFILHQIFVHHDQIELHSIAVEVLEDTGFKARFRERGLGWSRVGGNGAARFVSVVPGPLRISRECALDNLVPPWTRKHFCLLSLLPFFFLHHQTCARPHAAAPVPSRPAGDRGHFSCAEGKPPVKKYLSPSLIRSHLSLRISTRE